MGAKEDVKYLDLQEIAIFHPFVFCIPQTSQPTKRQKSKWKDDITLYSLLILLSISKPLVTYLTAYFKSNEKVGGSTEGTWQDRAVRRKGCPVASWDSWGEGDVSSPPGSVGHRLLLSTQP